MELEELKKQWAEMSKELEQQKIINRQIIEQSCKSKANYLTFNSVFAICLAVIANCILIWSNDLLCQLLPMWYIILIYVAIDGALINQSISLYFLLKMKKPQNNIIERERWFMKFRICERINIIWQSVISIPLVVAFIFIYNNLHADYILKPTSYAISVMIIATAIAILVSFFYAKQIKELKSQIQILKQFEK